MNINDNYSFTRMAQPLKYPVYDKENGNIPAGATDVEIAFGQSSKTYKNTKTGKVEHQNVYRWHGKIYNA